MCFAMCFAYGESTYSFQANLLIERLLLARWFFLLGIVSRQPARRQVDKQRLTTQTSWLSAVECGFSAVSWVV